VPLVAALLQIETGDRYPPLALSPQYQKQRTLEVLVDHVEGLAAAHPVMVIFEDVHWADATTLEMLALLIERSQRLPILVLITFRAGFYPPWSNQGNVLQLSLARLTQHQAQTLVDEVIGNKELPEGLVDEIVAKSDGVPLFVEELTKTTIESEVLIESGGRYELARPLPVLKLPATLQDSLLARLDRLGPAKDVAQLAATIGREFTYDLLQAVSSASSDQLVTSLDQLMRMELVICWGAPPTSSYSFKHALIQEAAHQYILKSKRRRLHAQIASVLERQFLDTSPEVLAYHLTEAGDVKKAVTNWKAAGELAIHRSGAMRGIG
jgi:predicted ATPase